MSVYYNENDPMAAAWLRELMRSGLLPEGEIDTRSIAGVQPADVAEYTQCHFFAGIGGWAYALQLADWPESRPIWTGSCPCQPFSAAGKRKGTEDTRHLWPELQRLISECHPPEVLGEQVASADGRKWLDGVRLDLEALGYAVGASDLCAASVGAPHIRQRLWWVANANKSSDNRRAPSREQSLCYENEGSLRVADGIGARLEGREIKSTRQELSPPERSGDVSGLAITRHESIGRMSEQAKSCHPENERRPCAPSQRSGDNGWGGFDLIPYFDGKSRRVEPGTFPLAHGVPARMGRLRGYGNAIVPALAAEFVRTYMECK